MAQSGVIGNGTKVGYGAASPVTWINVGQLLNADVPGLAQDEIETTIHSTGGFKRFMRGLKDVTEMGLTLLADLDETTDVVQDALFDYQAAGTTLWWRIEIPTARDQSRFTAFEFQGFVKNWLPSAPIEGRQELRVTVRFDGTSFAKYPAGASQIS